MQASLFSDSSVKSTPPPAPVKKKRTRKSRKVSRGTKLKRHPSRPPVVKRVVKTKQVVMNSHPDGPRGDIIERDGDDLMIQWPGMSRLYQHNARYMTSVEDE